MVSSRAKSDTFGRQKRREKARVGRMSWAFEFWVYRLGGDLIAGLKMHCMICHRLMIQKNEI